MRADTNFKGSDSRYPSDLIVILCLNHICIKHISAFNEAEVTTKIERHLYDQIFCDIFQFARVDDTTNNNWSLR